MVDYRTMLPSAARKAVYELLLEKMESSPLNWRADPKRWDNEKQNAYRL